jgi:tripartite ATP-independent transporter DctM subunit
MPIDTLVGLLGFVAMLSMVLVGVPIFVSMISVCFVCLLAMPSGGWDMVIAQFTRAPFSFAANFQFAVLPLFMLLGMLAGSTGVGQGAYNAIEKWTNWMPGGLMMATVGGNALFGAVSGMSTAANMVFCKIAMPELVKHGYDKNLSMGLITASGALDSLIPPSMPIIIFCILSASIIQLDIGRALIGGIGPGIVLALIYCVIIYFLHRIRPEKVPGRPDIKVTWGDRARSLKLLIPVVIFFALVIGGTYWGWFSATVGGAIGSAILIIYGVCRGVGLKSMIKSAWEACVMNAGFFPIIIAGQMFGRFIALSRLPNYIADWITTVQVPHYVVFLMVVVFYIICGMIMDIASILIITIPIVVPLLMSVGYNPYVIVIFLVMVGEMAGLTPPIGMNVFAVANALRVDPGLIFKGMWPFFLGEVILVLLMPVLPWITTGIPDLINFGS